MDLQFTQNSSLIDILSNQAYSSAPTTKLIRKKVKKIKTPRNTVEEFLRRQSKCIIQHVKILEN